MKASNGAQSSAEAEVECLRDSLKMLMQKYTESQRDRSEVQESMINLQNGMKSEMSKLQEEAKVVVAKSSEWEARYQDLEAAHYHSTLASSKTSMVPGSREAERIRHYEANATPPADSGFWPNTPLESRQETLAPRQCQSRGCVYPGRIVDAAMFPVPDSQAAPAAAAEAVQCQPRCGAYLGVL